MRINRFYKQLIPANSLCFDIGANHGRYTSLLLNCKARIVSVEPQENCFSSLQKLFGKNDNVVLIRSAVGSKAANAMLHIGNNDEISTLSVDFISAYSIYPYNAWDNKQEVVVITLDQLIMEYGLPFFCKLDIEGWEPEALKGLSQPLPFISLEYNFLLRSKAQECITMLADKGEYLFNFSPYERCKFSSDEWMDEKNFAELISELPGTILHGDIFARLVNTVAD